MALRQIIVDGSRPSRPKIPAHISETRNDQLMDDSLWALVQECWSGDPRHRPQASQCYTRLFDMNLSGQTKSTAVDSL